MALPVHWVYGTIKTYCNGRNKIKEIPKISFLKKSNAQIEFEILKLDTLFSRQDKLDISLDKPHRVEFYHILFITKGTGTHWVDFKPYHYKKGSILFISKGQVHEYEVRPDRNGFLILFTESFLSKNLIHTDILSLYRLYNYHLHFPIMQPEEMGKTNFINIINEIYEEYNFSDNFAKEETLRLLLKLLLLKAERIKRTLVPQETNAELFIKFGVFRSHLEKHFTMSRNAKEYAEMMNISYKHLNEICKSISGYTVKGFIDNFVILEIKRHLAMSDISVKELTYEIGFDEPTNFVKFFKKHTNQSPSKFKQMLIK